MVTVHSLRPPEERRECRLRGAPVTVELSTSLDGHALSGDGKTVAVDGWPPDADGLAHFARQVASFGRQASAVIESTNGAYFVHGTFEPHGWKVEIADAMAGSQGMSSRLGHGDGGAGLVPITCRFLDRPRGRGRGRSRLDQEGWSCSWSGRERSSRAPWQAYRSKLPALRWLMPQ